MPELFLLLQPPPTHLCLKLEFLLKTSFLLSLSLTLRIRTVLMVSLLWFSKLVLLSLHPALVNFFVYVFLLQPSLLAGNVHSFSLCRRRGTPLNPPNIVPFLSLYYRYYSGHCSSELSRRIPPPLRKARATSLSTQSHPFSVQLSDPRLNSYALSYMYSTGKVWNTLPSSIFFNFL